MSWQEQKYSDKTESKSVRGNIRLDFSSSKMEKNKKMCFEVEFIICVLKGLDSSRKKKSPSKMDQEGWGGSGCQP